MDSEFDDEYGLLVVPSQNGPMELNTNNMVFQSETDIGWHDNNKYTTPSIQRLNMEGWGFLNKSNFHLL